MLRLGIVSLLVDPLARGKKRIFLDFDPKKSASNPKKSVNPEKSGKIRQIKNSLNESKYHFRVSVHDDILALFQCIAIFEGSER